MANSVAITTPTPFERFLLGSTEAIVDKFFSTWMADSILRLRRLNSNFLLAVEAYTTRVWSVDQTFDRWFLDIDAFLDVLDECEGIIAGSEGQQHFARHEFRGKDLDIYVPCHGLLKMGRYLKQHGFHYQSSGGKHVLFDAAAVLFSAATMRDRDLAGREVFGSPSPNTYSAFNFYRNTDNNIYRMLSMDGYRIQVIAVHGNPVQFLLYHFHSSRLSFEGYRSALTFSATAGVMNYITGKYAVSLFPHHTFTRREMFICQDTTRNVAAHQAWAVKYKGRGYTVIGPTDSVTPTRELRAWERTVGDKFTWVIPHQRSGTSQYPLTQMLLTMGAVVPGKLKVEIPPVRFEVLPARCGVAAAGAALRVGPPFIYR